MAEATMGKLTPAARAAMVKRVKELDAKMQNQRLSIERVDEMHKERSELRARLLEDRAEGS
jgi:hypothetical protein